MRTVIFEDHGQDFLEWDMEDGTVVACRPFQDWLWNGTKVHSTDIRPGLLLDITPPHVERTRLRYPVEGVKEACDHDWIKLRNEVITSGEICTKCKAVRAECV